VYNDLVLKSIFNLKIIKMRNLENYQVQELSLSEAQKIDGGWLLEALGVVSALISLWVAVDKAKDKKEEEKSSGGGGGGGSAMSSERNVRIY